MWVWDGSWGFFSLRSIILKSSSFVRPRMICIYMFTSWWFISSDSPRRLALLFRLCKIFVGIPTFRSFVVFVFKFLPICLRCKYCKRIIEGKEGSVWKFLGIPTFSEPPKREVMLSTWTKEKTLVGIERTSWW